MKRSPAVPEITCFGLFLQKCSLLVSSERLDKGIFIKLPLFPQCVLVLEAKDRNNPKKHRVNFFVIILLMIFE